jgi:uncharacterized protein YqfA (UPF0365 family)
VFEPLIPFFAAELGYALRIGGIVAVAVFALLLAAVLFSYGALWFQAYMSSADVGLMSLMGMTFRRVKPSIIVTAKVMVTQAGLNINRHKGISTARLESHFLAGGDVMRLVRAIVAAHRAGLDLDFDRAAAIDLAGRDVLDAVRTSVFPQVINCPDPQRSEKTMVSGVAKNGVELHICALVTVRTNLDQLVGGATEETIIARVGQGIISAIGSARTHMDVMEMPDRVSQAVLQRGLDANTAFEIVSIDIADVEVGKNIGARLQSDQAEADMRMAEAQAEVRRVAAIAWRQEMKAKLAENHAKLLLSEARIPSALAMAIRAGQLRAWRPAESQTGHGKVPLRGMSPVDHTLSPRRPFVGRAEGVPMSNHVVPVTYTTYTFGRTPATTPPLMLPDSRAIEAWEGEGGQCE